jgi:outer membrane protein assembly factor BamB
MSKQLFGASVAAWIAGLAWTAVAADWPQFLGPERDGVSREKGPIEPWPKVGPAVVWEQKVGAGFSGPVVAGERLILFLRVGDNEVVQCFSAPLGKENWKFEYPTSYRDDFGFDEGPRATSTIAGNHIYTLGAEGTLLCLDLETGKKIWQRNVNEDYQVRKGFFGVGTSPLVEGGLLLVNVGGKGAGIVAFDKETGKEVWKATDHEASYSSPVATTIDGQRHVFFFTREGLVSLDPATGNVRFSKRWRSRINASVNAAAPLVLDGHVFVSACYDVGAGLFRIRKDGPEEVWKSDEVLSCHYNTPVRHGDFLFGLHGRQEFGVELRCIEWKTGKVRWKREKFGCASLIRIDQQIVALTEEGHLVLFEASPEGYQEKARAAVLNSPCRAHIALANGRLFARDGKRLVCWELKK